LSLPGLYRGGDERYRSGCGCIVIGVLVALAVVGGLIALGFYVTDLMEAGWQK